MDQFSVFISVFLSFLMSILAALGVNPVKTVRPPEPGVPQVDLTEEYLFSSTEEYKAYYEYISVEEEQKIRSESTNPEHLDWLVPFVNARANVEKELEQNGFYYTLYKNKTAAVKYATAASADINIPAEVNGYKVVTIYRSFIGAGKVDPGKVQSIVIPDTVEFIGEGAFEQCSSLKTVQIGRRVRFMAPSVFASCRKLTVAILPDSLDEVSVCTFDSCYALTVVELGGNVRKIDDSAFIHCMFLKNVTLPESVGSIEAEAFLGCKNLTGIYIPSSVTSIDDSAFEQCGKLTIHGEAGSYAESFAKQNGIPFAVGK